MLNKEVEKKLKKQHYAIVGKHSAIQICRWTKKSLVDEGFCYKEKFYGIKSHRCCQMSPYIACFNSCLHCWRPIELETGLNLKPNLEEIDEPKEIIERCILAQRKMLSGFGGNKKLNKKKFKEAQEPNQFAISLIGEPTIYPKIGEFIEELRKKKKTSFLVTSGLLPEKLKELARKNQLPTQLYISLNSPNKKHYEKWHRSKLKDAWDRFNESLELMKKIKKKTRTVVRLTLVKNENMHDKDIEGYTILIKKAYPLFVEVKGYMAVGYARKRLGYEKMPSHSEIKKFAEKLCKELNKLGLKYKLLDEKKESRVVVLGEGEGRLKIREEEI